MNISYQVKKIIKIKIGILGTLYQVRKVKQLSVSKQFEKSTKEKRSQFAVPPNTFGDNVDCHYHTCQKSRSVHKRKVPESEIAAENEPYSHSNEACEVEMQPISLQEFSPRCEPIITSREVRTRFHLTLTLYMLKYSVAAQII